MPFRHGHVDGRSWFMQFTVHVHGSWSIGAEEYVLSGPT